MFADQAYGQLSSLPPSLNGGEDPAAHPVRRAGPLDDPALVITLLAAVAVMLGWLSVSVEASAG